MLKKLLSVKLSSKIIRYIYNNILKGPRWPSGKVSALEPEGSRPDSTEDPPCMGPIARQIIRSGQTPSRWCGVEAWRGGRQPRCRPRHLTEVQNYEVQNHSDDKNKFLLRKNLTRGLWIKEGEIGRLEKLESSTMEFALSSQKTIRKVRYYEEKGPGGRHPRRKRKVWEEMENYLPRRPRDPSAMYTLFAGDKGSGPTLSFVFVYRQHVMHKAAYEFITVILPEGDRLKILHSRQVHILRSLEVTISTTVKLPQFEKHRVVRGQKFGKIFFYFPTKSLQCNRIRKFFLSSKKVSTEGAKIFITLSRKKRNAHVHLLPRRMKKGWSLVRVAANAGLRLCEAMPFTHHISEEYEFRENKDIIRAVNTAGAVSYTFERAQVISPREITRRIPIIWNADRFYESIKECFKSLSKKHQTTYARLVLALNSVSKRSFTSMDTILVNDLLNCENSASVCDCNPQREEDPDYHITELCDKNLSTMISKFLQAKTTDDDAVTSMIFSVHCPHFFKAHFHPFVHILSYFSFSWDTINKGLAIIVKQLKREFPVNVPDFCWDDIPERIKTSTLNTCALASTDYKRKHIQTIYAVCTFEEDDGWIFYAILDIAVRKGNVPPPPSSPTVQVFEIGRLMRFTVFNKDCYVTLWNLEMLSCIQFHVMDYGRLLLDSAYFCRKSTRSTRILVYRPVSLYPPVYNRYVTFWVDETFLDMALFMLVWNVAADIIKSVKLIKACKDEFTQREMRIYRFSYRSDEKILSCINATKIHKILVKAIESHLQVRLK
ncbi:hypothetical protein AVEN_94954-1 [Araneus ventricosus]|uniref:FDX-ACB domain-containing protein n=1 Tax=Araneus ventricosus TaxID=182803 RepID=A0A4Y2DJU0_ARAVE|nr:hypothetical protein AVEN_94954-1 [Araneus ventricosus]